MKLIILTSSRSGFPAETLKALHEGGENQVVLVVRSLNIEPKSKRLIRRKILKIRQIGLLGALNGVRIRKWYRSERGGDLEALCGQYRIPYFETPTTNGKRTEDLFRGANAELGLSLGNGYISPRIFNIPRFGMINFHGELLPAYQNAQSVIWPIFNFETETGYTIHQVDQSIDTGDILFQERYPIQFRNTLRETVIATNILTQQKAPRAMSLVCDSYLNYRSNARPQRDGRKYTTPSLGQYLQMEHNNRVLYRKNCGH